MGNVQFYNGKVLFSAAGKVAMHEDCCCLEDCAGCLGNIPSQMQVTIAGIVNKAPADCSDCPNLNAPYVLDRAPNVGETCVWEYTFPEAICGVNTIWLGAVLGPPAVLRVNFLGEDGCSWWKTYESAHIDCENLDSESLAIVLGMASCQTASSTASVTAL